MSLGLFPVKTTKYPPSEKLLLFFGSPRTGSTLLGQILNNHPNMLVANEYRFLQKVVRNQACVEQQFYKLRKTALKQFKTGLKKDSYFSNKLSKFQSQWIEFDNSLLEKQDIKIVGDKKAGGNTLIYIEQPTKTKRFLANHEPYMLQIIRHPINAALSACKAFDLEYEDAIKDQIMRTTEAYRLMQEFQIHSHFVYYEDLINDTENVLNGIMAFLKLFTDEYWMKSVLTSVNSSNKVTAPFSENQRSIARHYIDRYQANDIFKKYCDIM